MKKSLLIIGAFLLAQVVAGIIIAIPLIMQAASQGAHAVENFQTGTTELLISLMVADVLIIVATILICRKGWAAPFRWNMPMPRGLLTMLLSLVGCAALVILTEALSEWLQLPDLLEDTFMAASLSPLALWAIALIGPLTEEVACRYGIVGSLLEMKRCPVWVAVVVSAILFSLLHMIPSQMLVAFILGIYLGWLYVTTRSLWPCILCHVANNAVSVILMRLYPNPDDQTLTAFVGGTPALVTLLGISAAVLLITILALRNTNNQ